MTSLTTYVVTRDYRAPELLVENKVWSKGQTDGQFYNNRIDIWSVGIVFAEMLHGSALFKVHMISAHHNQAGSASKLLELILSYLGKPKEEVIVANYFDLQDLQMIEKDSVRQFVQNLQPIPKPLLRIISRQVPSDAADLLLKLLTFNPNKRISANVIYVDSVNVQEALNHPFFSDLSSTLQPLTCKSKYDAEWEERFEIGNFVIHRVMSTHDQSVLWTQFLKEQEYYPVVKCKYQAKQSFVC